MPPASAAARTASTSCWAAVRKTSAKRSAFDGKWRYTEPVATPARAATAATAAAPKPPSATSSRAARTIRPRTSRRRASVVAVGRYATPRSEPRFSSCCNSVGAAPMKIIYTLTDEAPALATRSLLPIVEAFAGAAGVEVEPRDISLAGRMLAQFPERLDEDRRVPDALAELGELARTPEANIIKLPNISASVPQLKAAIQELQEQGYAIPDYPEDPADDAEREVRARYDRVKGSAVNPVLREGNSDRRAPASVKAYARAHPHPMGAWSRDVAVPRRDDGDGDFRSTERSVTVGAPATVRIEHVAADGDRHRPQGAHRRPGGRGPRRGRHAAGRARRLPGRAGAGRPEQGVLFSVHLKATMMKVSDPIIFGHAVRAYFPELFAEHGDALASVGVSPKDGLASLERAIEALPDDERAAVEAAIDGRLRARAGARDGRLGQRHHEPPRPERRDHRRLDAGRDPRVGADVERRRASSRTRST